MFSFLNNYKKFKVTDKEEKKIPENLYTKCESCLTLVYHEDLNNHDYICPKCNFHFRLNAMQRLDFTLDPGTFREFNKLMKTKNILKFPKYSEKINKVMKETDIREAVVTGYGEINGKRCVVAVMDSHFFMGSMGTVVGEKISQAVERSIKNKLPLIIFTASGGARMQEGIFSLMQMAKVSSTLKKHHDQGLLYVSVLTHPTTGGVTASFAMLGDIILAEPGALIGFAGPRVIKQTIRQELPEGFQSSEFLQEHGFVDAVVPRKKMKEMLHNILVIHEVKP
ncbi:acetyl-CoA carboxylase carboxyltransferase subunit beta [Alkalibaculum sp. M08DMB]|uniref:Acetyl-coenzyme A carboxylase carboxyl transferase subunit beta n=1 Tax=Alkalibaculum sporogenes TaxID=2655001 RepID=A0A6A7KAJ2_9FIRM|nr:acetyl-CoA carboxylase carboxyltransferase subunit beta [Alkalibaculum sporogenes]